MKNKLIISVSILAFLLFIACAILFINQSLKIRVNAMVSPELLPVKVQSSGVLKNVYVELKQNVSKGQLIAEIEVPGKTQLQSINTSKSNLPLAKAKLVKAEEKYKNSALMYKDGVISQEDYDKSLKNLTSAQNEYKAAVVKSKTISAQDNKQNEAVTVKKVYAPQDGVVYTNLLTKGTATNPNKPIVILALNTPKVIAYVDDKTALKLKSKQEVQIQLENDKLYDGIIEMVSDRPYDTANSKKPKYIIYIGFKENLNSSNFEPSQPVSVIFKK